MKNLLACLAMLAAFNVQAQDWDANNDVDQDGCVGVGDVLQILSVYGSCEPASTCVSPTMDGYSYDVVEIGDQCWFAENLRTTIYANGDVIPAGLTDGEWTSNNTGATAVYGEGSSVCNNYSLDIDACDEAQSLAEFGRLYNWYAVDYEYGLCPIGWHVPTDGEWTVLENYISAQGYNGAEGAPLKSTYGWYDNGNGTDLYGFTGTSSGWRHPTSGDFNNGGRRGFWWSSSSNGSEGWDRALYSSSSEIYRFSASKYYGLAIRCLMDAE